MPFSRRSPSRLRARRPHLFFLVYGAIVLLVILTIAGMAALVSEHLTASAVRSLVTADQATVRDFVARTPAAALAPTSREPGQATLLASELDLFAQRGGFVGARLMAPDGTVVASAGGAERGQAVARDERFIAALGGRASAVMVGAEAGHDAPMPVLSQYWPVLSEGRVTSVLEVRRDGTTLAADANAIRRDVAVVTASAAVLLAALLYLIFRGAQLRLGRQAHELLESTRRDALTGLLNHGAVIERLAATLDYARNHDGAVGVALVDIDNFRLLNETHGHNAGDTVLQKVVRAIDEEPGSWATVGRYGPDEFLLISHPGGARQLEPAVKRLRERLRDVAVRFGRSERLPVTVSVGIAHFPFHAAVVTELLSEATIALGEAKASGGDAIRVCGAWDREPGAERNSFDILQGLVIAIDTKDRYTKRHSEDVSRYAQFLGEQLGLDEKLLETLRVAGLLHDVGKIGIPDDILRKPGALTPYEYEVVKQHVALGDLIVRDVPNLWLVRAGIKHHHERWDGTGYLDRLAGESIPLVARILAVGDAFSAMTTTRPYRKAYTVEAALERLREVAGSQLDPDLVHVFVGALEKVPGAPLPGQAAPPRVLTRPRLVERVA